jgi:hypothetical protein
MLKWPTSIFKNILQFYLLHILQGARGNVVKWKHYATSQNVSGFIPDEVAGFFNWPNLSSRTMVLG